MKTFLPTLLVLCSLLSLVSCGQGGQSSASLQITRGFAMTNPNFGGGLIIAGKNLTNGNSFSKGLTTSMSLNIVLDKGTWLITAVGWDGGTTSNVPFGGMPYCGKVTKNLSNDNETIDLSVTTTECATSFFAGSHANVTNTSFKALTLINTCNTFFDGNVATSDTINSKVVTSGPSTDSFCESVASDLQTKVQSVKIYALNKDLKTVLPSLGFSSGCLKAGTQKSKIDPASVTPANPYPAGSDLRLPIAGLPFMIVTYDDDSCSKPVAQYPFKNGLAAGDPEKFDHLLYARNTNDIKLILPGSDLRRGYSAFQAIMPLFQRYNSGVPAKFLTAPPSNSYKFHGIVSQNNVALLENVNTCSTVTPDGTYVTSATCTDLGDVVQIDWSGSSEGAGTFTMNSMTYNVYLDNNSFGRNRFEAQKVSMELLGHDGDYDARRFFGIDNHDDEAFGALSVVRDMLSPHAAGGVIGVVNSANSFASECLSLTTDKTIKIFNYEKLQEETYRVVLSNSPTTAPGAFTCSNSNLDESDCTANGNAYDKRMIIYDYRISAAAPSMALEFNCTTKLGKMEITSIETEGILKEESKQIVSWNTDESSNYAYQRFERVAHNKQYKYAGGWVQIDENRQMARVLKTDPENYEAWVYSFNAHKNLASSFDQRLDIKRLKTVSGTNLNYISISAAGTNPSPVYIFTDVANSSLVSQLPASQSNDNFFNPNDSFPQGSTGTSATFNALATDFSNATQINGNLNFRLDSLNSATFTGSTFGTSFLTTP